MIGLMLPSLLLISNPVKSPFLVQGTSLTQTSMPGLEPSQVAPDARCTGGQYHRHVGHAPRWHVQTRPAHHGRARVQRPDLLMPLVVQTLGQTRQAARGQKLVNPSLNQKLPDH